MRAGSRRAHVTSVKESGNTVLNVAAKITKDERFGGGSVMV